MTNFLQKLSLTMLTALGVGATGFWNTAAVAATFSNRPIDSDRVVAIASPIGTTSHQLLILEQLSTQRRCWQETGNTVDPLLLDFDFTGICGRGTDSNGYSLRVGGEDLGWRYNLRIVQNGSTLRLVASSTTERNGPPIEIGTAQAVAGNLVEISLNPGWSITKRVYNGQTLGHYYLTHAQPLTTLLAEARSNAPSPSPGVATRPTTPSAPPVMAVQPPNPPTVPPAPSLTRPVTPGSTTGSSNQIARSGVNYRVIVPATSSDIPARVRAVVPDAFRTTINGQLVMQAGAFRERVEAEVMKQRLIIYNLRGTIIEVADNPSSPGDSPSRPPSNPPATPPSRPSNPSPLPTVPNGRYVVVIDPGHGGRDPGAVGIGGLRETDVVLDVSRQVEALLEQQGVQVVMTRSTEQFVDLAPRVAIAERANADLFVSIHANAISLSRPEVNGAETYYYSSSAGYRLAQSIQRSILQRTGMGDRGVREARFYVLRNTSMPAALVETGFVTGSQDAPRLRDPAFRTRMAEAIAQGILDYLR